MTATTTIKGYDRLDGDYCGTYQPVRFGDGSVGYQIVDEDDDVIGMIDRHGNGDNVFAGGCREWELCEETDAHRLALARVDSVRFERE